LSILVVGSVAFDSIKTPFGEVDRALGGSATYFSVAASFFTPVQLVAVVGDDFGEKEMEVFNGRPIDLSGLTRVTGRTFYWSGEYGFDLNVAQTRDTQLNVFADFKPDLPQEFRNTDVLFLANIHPELQLEVLRQCKRPRLVALDTMNYWISSARDAVERIIREVDLLVFNEAEVRQFTGEANILKAARQVLDLGPKTLVLKRGEYGVLMITRDNVFAAPAYPLETVFDPTGAGDTFAGGFLGYLTSAPELSEAHFRRAIIYGSVLASFNVESFSLDRIRSLTRREIDDRYRSFRALTHFEDVEMAVL
jgi:sugar/nucleoside kinase (ribokinase family)